MVLLRHSVGLAARVRTGKSELLEAASIRRSIRDVPIDVNLPWGKARWQR
jgi:hypothetical protein